MLFILKENKKRFKIHPYYIISFILIIVFVVIPSIYFSKYNNELPLNWKCKNLCSNGNVEKLDNGICYCSDGQVIDLDKLDNEVENEKK